MNTYFVDSFTDEPFKGNPAAVCFPEQELDPATMQHIATEIGFSETAFVRKGNKDDYRIRFFTPKQEIPLCGHATLAASKIVFDTTGRDAITFHNIEDVALQIGRRGKSITMEFPAYDTVELQVPRAVPEALGIGETLDTRYSPKNKIILLEIEGTATLAGLQPDFAALLASYRGINGVLVTARSEEDDYDFHYRYFWPWAGTNEDPVTGGVQTFLTPYWAAKLQKRELNAFQSSRRTGRMRTEWRDDKVLISGEAVTVFEGQFKQ